MNASSQRWKEISRSEFPWEQEALAFIRDRLHDRDPYRAWANFEFIADDGSVNEVDLLVLTPKGLFLIEIKSRPGQVTGDAGTWTWHHEGRQISVDNPLLLANRKAKRLANLLRRQKACNKIRVPFVEPLVFLSAPNINCTLDSVARQGTYPRDTEPQGDRPRRPGIIAALTGYGALPAGEVAQPYPGTPVPPRFGDSSGRRADVDVVVARALSRAMEDAGIRASKRQQRVADYELVRLLFDGPGYQDWEARHVSLTRLVRRIRRYTVAAKGPEARQTLARAALREFQILQGIEHPGILRAVDYHEHELGPCLVFEHDPATFRLDHFLLEYGQRLDVDLRLGLLRQIAEALNFAHGKKLVHRALSPQSVLVLNPTAPAPQIQIFNWQTASRAFGSTSRGATATLHVGELIETGASVYMAPEARTDPEANGEQLDVFSLGAIAYHLFAGQPPATSMIELAERLRDGKGLQIASVLNGAGENLCSLIQYSTHPEVTSRLDSVSGFLTLLEDVEDELTAPPEDRALRDPTEATQGDRLEGGYVVNRRLGKGSTAVVFLVEKDGREWVLKLALDHEQNQRLLEEAEVLRKLRHQHIAELVDTVTIGGHQGLLMEKAGEETLAQRLRAEGRLHVDLLQRFGEDLLQALQWLDHQGIPHRDIKPDNIAVAPIGRSDRLHLVLFDFSLSRAPADRIRAGTVPYLDPFLALRKPPRWDLHAERYAAAMTLYEMATGTLPRWGDGKSDPAVLDCEVALDGDLFEASLRERLTAFFEKALRRDFRRRFDNTEEMLRAWRRAFEHLDRSTITTEHGDEATLDAAIAAAVPETELAALGLSTRAINALDRANAMDVRGLLRLPVARLSHMRGVGNKTRRELLELRNKLKARFPDQVEVDVPPAPEDIEGAEPQVSSVDLLAKQLLPARGVRGASSEPAVLTMLLGLDEAKPARPGIWPSQTEAAIAHGITPGGVWQILARARERWSRNPSLTSLREAIVELLRAEGGVMTAAELTRAVLAARGSAAEEPRRSRLASAVTRAASEAERHRATPRWTVRRSGELVLLALDEAVEGQRLADYAEQLGRTADRLAVSDPLPSPSRVLETLQAVRPPEGHPALSAARLVRLAAAASAGAAVSSRLELYPRRMPAERALKLSQGALLGAPELTVEQIRERVRARYPEAEPLPGRPALDRLLTAAASRLAWVAEAAQGRGAYQAPKLDLGTLSSGSTPVLRAETGQALAVDTSPEIATARHLEEQLQRAAREGAFLALTVDARHLERAECELSRRFNVEVRSVEAALIQHMKAEASRSGAEWSVVLRADAAAPSSRDWQNLLVLVRRALAAFESELAAAERTVLLTHPGLLARYDQVGFLERLRDRVGRRPEPGAVPLHGLWVLVPSDDAGTLPVLDGRAVPVIGPSQWARLTRTWVENAHRAATVATPAGPRPAEVPR
jgi:serine/threonine protein kinase